MRPRTSPSTPVVCRDQWVDAAGDRLFVRRLLPPAVAGSGPTLVLLHEGLGSVEQWKHFPEQLVAATGRPAVLYDRIGHGRSGPLDRARRADYLERAADEELPALLAAAGVARPLLVGHSDGGTIALLFAARYPTAAVLAVAAHVSVEDAALKGIVRTVAAWDEGRLEQRLARYHGEKTAPLFRAWANTWLAPWFRDWNVEARLPEIRCPVAVVQGSRDEYATAEHAHRIVAGVRGPATLQLLPGCGHSPHLEYPDALVEIAVQLSQTVMTYKPS